MPIPNPPLEERTWDDLVAEAINRIPLEAPQWTDHNPSDPGIILIELLAWLTEMVLYRLHQIPPANQAVFLSLLKGKPWTLPPDLTTTAQAALIQAEIQKTLAELRHPYRAVTPQDFEQLILIDWLKTRTAQRDFGTDAEIARVHCLPQRDLDHAEINQVVEGHITLVVLTRYPQADTQLLRHTLGRFLNQRRLLSTHLHIIEPHWVNVTLNARLYLEDSADFRRVRQIAQERVHQYFAPLDSQDFWQGQGYPFGADIYFSQLYELLDGLPGVDYVEDLTLTDIEPERQQFNEQNQVIGLSIQDHELVRIQIGEMPTLQRFREQWKTNPN
ncbi:hypothetical protein [Spirulina subsalsa]|uniref:hypothetical protein n=1 Tax=Spirulina subsalsa TaxID=54311 RepID=UPI00036286E5|nr:hypothetical protein [Spirulina subsalsa]